MSSTVQDPPFTASTGYAYDQARRAGEELRDTVSEKVQEGKRSAQELKRAATESLQKLKGSAGELFDTTEKRTLTITTMVASVGLGFLAGFLVAKSR